MTLKCPYRPRYCQYGAPAESAYRLLRCSFEGHFQQADVAYHGRQVEDVSAPLLFSLYKVRITQLRISSGRGSKSMPASARCRWYSINGVFDEHVDSRNDADATAIIAVADDVSIRCQWGLAAFGMPR